MNDPAPFPFRVAWHDRLPSTNAYLREQAKGNPGLPSGTLVAAREQTAGRGRHGRGWVSHAGNDLTFSFYVRSHAMPRRIPALTMATALGVCELLERYGVAARVKWPNDVLVNRRKVCGTLSERVGEGVVVGVGLNVNMSAEDAVRIDQPATSLAIETGRSWSVDGVLTDVLGVLPRWLHRWGEDGFNALREAWTRAHAGVGQAVTIREGGVTREGVLEGFGEDGQLLLRNRAGGVDTVWTGDLTSA